MIGESILNMMGGEDPRLALMRSLMATGGMPAGTPAAQGATPGQPDPTSAPAAGGAGAPVAAAPQQPRAYQSPQDLVSLYSQIQDRERRANAIDRGLMMIAASGARPENKQALLQSGLSSGGGGGGSSGGGGPGASMTGSPLAFIQGVQQLQQSRAQAMQTAARRAALPQLAERYGVPVEAMTQMFDTGKLEDFISNAEKPNRQVQTLANGQVGIIELGGRNPRMIGTYGPEKPPETRTMTDGAGQIVTVDPRTNIPVGPAAGAARQDESERLLGNINRERAAANQPPMTMEQYLQMNPRGTTVRNEINAGQRKEDEVFAGILGKEYEAASSQQGTLRSIGAAQSALNRGIIAGSAGSPIELEARRAFGSVFGLNDQQIANTDEFISATRGIVRSAVKDLGSGNGITDSDRKFVEQQVGATNTLGPDSLRRLLVLQELKSRESIERYNAEAERTRAGNPNSRVRVVEMPAPSEDLVRRVPPQAIQRANEELAKANTPQEREVLRREFNTMYGSGMFEHLMRQR